MCTEDHEVSVILVLIVFARSCDVSIERGAWRSSVS